MQNDAVIWELLGKGMCSFKRVLDKGTLCINEYNVTGVCTKVNCPLSNSVYATVILEKGEIYLYVKTAERCHLPSRMWNRIHLSHIKKEAFNVIYKELKYLFNVRHIKKCMKRYSRLKEIIKRSRKLVLQQQLKLQPVKKKTERRDKTREMKSLKSANILTNVEKELLNRLNEGLYGSLYNFLKPSKKVKNKEQEMAEVDDQVIKKEKRKIKKTIQEQEDEQILLQERDDDYYEGESSVYEEEEDGEDEYAMEEDEEDEYADMEEDEEDEYADMEDDMESNEYETEDEKEEEEEEEYDHSEEDEQLSEYATEEEEEGEREENEKKIKSKLKLQLKKKERVSGKQKQKRKLKYVKEYVDDDHIKQLQNEGKLPKDEDVEELSHKIKKRKSNAKKSGKKLIHISYEN